MSAPLILKHCYENLNAPDPEQVQVGELVINSRTGKLYTRLALDNKNPPTPGPIVEFVGKQVCYDRIPSITFDTVDNFCCNQDILKVKVVDLVKENVYRYEIQDISGNNVIATINTPIYTDYTISGSGNSVVELQEATIPITVQIAGSKNLTILKFIIFGRNNDINQELTSRTITISCGNCG